MRIKFELGEEVTCTLEHQPFGLVVGLGVGLVIGLAVGPLLGLAVGLVEGPSVVFAKVGTEVIRAAFATVGADVVVTFEGDGERAGEGCTVALLSIVGSKLIGSPVSVSFALVGTDVAVPLRRVGERDGTLVTFSGLTYSTIMG